MLLTGLGMLGNGASIASHDPTARNGCSGRTGMVLGAVGLVVGVGGLLLEWHWNRRRS